MNNEVAVQINSKLIPTQHIEDSLTFKDFLDEIYVSWGQLSNEGKIKLISEYLAEEANADFLINESSNSAFKVVCSRLDSEVLLPSKDIDELSQKISEILSQLFGCAFRSQ